MAAALSDGGAREDRAQAVASAVAAIWLAAETALLAAITASARKAALAPGGGKAAASRLDAQAAVIIATAEKRTLEVLRRMGTGPDETVPGKKITLAGLVTAAGTAAYASARAILAAVLRAIPAAGPAPARTAAAQKALTAAARGGITGLTDRSGANWDVVSYLEMSVRTAVSDLADERQIAALAADGTGLALIYSLWAETACPKCRPFLGHVISLTGTMKAGTAVPGHGTVLCTYAEARARGWRHANCRCSMRDISDTSRLIPAETEAQGAARRKAAARRQEQQRRARHAAILAVLALTPHEKSRARGKLAALR